MISFAAVEFTRKGSDKTEEISSGGLLHEIQSEQMIMKVDDTIATGSNAAYSLHIKENVDLNLEDIVDCTGK